MKLVNPQILDETPTPPRDQLAARRHELAVVPTTSIWEPVVTAEVTTDTVLAQTKPPETLTPDLERDLIAIIVRPIRLGEGHQVGNELREQELRAALAALEPVDAFQMRRRLELDRATDALAVAFRRLVPDRRRRLIAFLADPKRRAANRLANRV